MLQPQNQSVNSQSYVSPYIGVQGDSSYYLASTTTLPTGTVSWGLIMGLDANGNITPATVAAGKPVQSTLVVFADQNGYSNTAAAPANSLYKCAIAKGKGWRILASAVTCQSGVAGDLTVLLTALGAIQESVNGVLYWAI